MKVLCKYNLIIIFGVISISIYSVTGENIDQHAGIYSHQLETANLIIPVKVNNKGEYLSHNLTHHHHSNNNHRQHIVLKQQLKQQQPIEYNEYNDNQLHYHININNETLHLELEPSKIFVSPLMVIERHRRDLRTRKRTHRHTNCHYQGRVRGQEQSTVALSACNGIAGLIKTNTGDYWVEPSKNHVLNDDKGHPHVLFQRSAVKTKQNNNNTAQNSTVHMMKKRKKKRKMMKKRHSASNCGTKEPKRLTETKIEWQSQGKLKVQGGRKTRGHHLTNNLIKNRTKRSISKPRHVEALIVADTSMVAFHQDGDVETYLLTIMNMVSSLYKDPAIGNLIHVVVVKIILLEEEEAHLDLNVTHMAESTLSNFCRWQRTLNPRDEKDPHHHDVAILITRKDICSTNGCTTLGVANVGGMCRPDRSCSVNEDNGISLAHTITHELGHNFGMYHDTEKTGCDRRTGSILHVMTPSFEADTIQVSWSNCSRRDITHFLDQGLGKCLDDMPSQQDFIYPELPPGAMYNAELQCRLQFNSTDDAVQVCSKPDEICSQLWCLVDDNCMTKMRPAAPGTHCGKHKWCQQQKCVAIEDLPAPVDGGWGNWSEWSECSRSCGSAVSIQTRQCDHPPPTNGGSFCVGERRRYKICNTEPCPEGDPSFRAQQCSHFNNETFRGQKYKWLPYFDTHEPCELYCTDSEDTVIVPWGNSAADGTRCNIGTNNMCISGICRKVGCDWGVDSNTTEDQCGICGGTGETCTTIKSEFNKKLNISDGYYEFAIIPKDSRHINIEENGASKNFIGIGKANSKKFYLNGDHMIFMSGEHEIAGALGLYERENELEKIKIPGPIKEDIALYILLRGKQKNFGIKYEYTLSSNSTAVPVYFWKLGDWTACTATCDGGIQHRMPICREQNQGVVDEENCWSNAENERPREINRVCNEDPCPAHWWIGPWQLCPVTCKRIGEPDPVKRRSIMCIDQKEMALSDKHCQIRNKPHDTAPCGQVLPLCTTEYTNENKKILDNNIMIQKN